MIRTLTPPKVFLSFAWSDKELAADLSDSLERAGLHVTRVDEVAPRGQYSDRLRDAVRESAAVVVFLSDVVRRRDIPASVLFEIGAAVGANKPIYVVVERMTEKLPFNAPDLHVLPLNRAQEIAQHLANDQS
jgi:hypothetical protein